MIRSYEVKFPFVEYLWEVLVIVENLNLRRICSVRCHHRLSSRIILDGIVCWVLKVSRLFLAINIPPLLLYSNIEFVECSHSLAHPGKQIQILLSTYLVPLLQNLHHATGPTHSKQTSAGRGEITTSRQVVIKRYWITAIAQVRVYL